MAKFPSISVNLVFSLAILTLLKGLVTAWIVPLWEFPDEQAHFAQVSYYVEEGLSIQGDDLSRELYEAERIMGTLRSDSGHNFYTYDPTYRPEYSQTIYGPNEYYLSNLPQEYRTSFIKREAAKYPPVFYLLSGIGYVATYSADIFVRVFASRFISILLTIASVMIAYELGRALFPKRRHFGLALAILVSFQPMFSFVGTGVNNDNLLNLLSMILIWQSVETYHRGLTYQRALLIGVVSGLGILTKPLMLPLIIPTAILLMIEWYKRRRSLKKELMLITPLLVGGIAAGGWFFLKPLLETGRLPYITNQKEYSGQTDLRLFDYLTAQMGRYYRETLVWYWGVFKWLGVILPLNLIRLIKIVMVFSGLGLLVSFVRDHDKRTRDNILMLLLFSMIYVAAISLWDYDAIRKNGFSHGLQGRYFFPTIGAHMALLLIGLEALVAKGWRLFVAKSLATGMIMSHLVSLYVLSSNYYELSYWYTFFIQSSQYKPMWFKYPYNVLLLVVYLISLIIFVGYLWKIKAQAPSKRKKQ